MDETVELKSSSRRPARLRVGRLLVLCLSLALLLTILIRQFFYDVYLIPSESMRPTLEVGDRIVISRQAHISRGDLVVFDGQGSFDPYQSGSLWSRHPLQALGQWLGVASPETIYVKRVIGVAGDSLSCCRDGKLLLNGQVQEEPYLLEAEPASELEFNVVVPEGRIWLMGDNRSVSRDSRALLGAPGGGMIRQDKVLGKVQLRIWPSERWEYFD
ncbi:MAG: signal peptidase I [Rothia sp. (in: high G+C Gram-positive bacteria)]|nr:signal peptidase I [Rothia sp. (in: high G+C Gram-positive bacteria)]